MVGVLAGEKRSGSRFLFPHIIRAELIVLARLLLQALKQWHIPAICGVSGKDFMHLKMSVGDGSDSE